MTAMLIKNEPMAVLPDSLTNSEVLKCEQDCPVSYTLGYDAGENRIEDGQNVLDLRREARTKIKSEHPLHLSHTCVWNRSKKVWWGAWTYSGRI